MKPSLPQPDAPYLTVELVNLCNLRCSYCVRDDDALHHHKAEYLAPAFLRRILAEARQTMDLQWVSFTGGEVTLHPNFAEMLDVVAEAGLHCSFITNGWHFDRVWPEIKQRRATMRSIAFSLDGATTETHDRWRGKGSFARVMKAFAQCHFHDMPFIVKVALRRDTVPQLEALAMLVARLGAAALHFIPFVPTDAQFAAEHMLLFDEQRQAEQEIAVLGDIFKMPIGIDVGYVNTDPAPPCNVLLRRSANIDYRGRLTLCCNLSGFRGGAETNDIIADLTSETLTDAHPRLTAIIEQQVERRRTALVNAEKDLYTASPCLFCLRSFGKLPWLKH